MNRARGPSFERIARVSTRIVLGVLAVISIVLLASWALVSRDPAWWIPPSNATPEAAESVERSVTNEIARSRPVGGRWAIDITEDAANAWLRYRLPKWLDHEGVTLAWPSSQMRIRFEPSVIRLGVDRGVGTLPRVVGVSARIAGEGDARITVTLRSAHLGGLAIGGVLAETIVRRLTSSEDLAEVRGILADGRPLTAPPIALEGHRRVELVGIAPSKGRVRLTFRVIDPPGPSGLP